MTFIITDTSRATISGESILIYLTRHHYPNVAHTRLSGRSCCSSCDVIVLQIVTVHSVYAIVYTFVLFSDSSIIVQTDYPITDYPNTEQ